MDCTLLYSVIDVLRRAWTRSWRDGRALVWLLTLLLVTTGCGALLPSKRNTRAPAVPTTVSTPYTNCLPCLGELIDKYYGREEFRLIVGVRPALDATRPPGGYIRDDVPWEFTFMLLTVLNSIQRGLLVSNVFLTPSGLEIGGRVHPGLEIQGAITMYQPGTRLRGKKFDIGAIGFWEVVEAIEAELEVQDAESLVGFDLMSFDFPSGVARPFAHSSLQVVLRRSSHQINAALAVIYVALGISAIEKEVDSVGTALRMLVELGVLQTIGRRYRLPYTRCLDRPMQDTFLERRIRDYFSAKSTRDQAALIRGLLREYHVSVSPHGPWNGAVEAGLEQLKQQYKFQWPAGDRAEAYRVLYMNLPLSPTKVPGV